MSMSTKIPSHLQPSIFEILSRDKLGNALQPAFVDVVGVFTRNSSRNWVRKINKYSDELFVLFYGALQFKYLFQYDGTFGENFYGMKRVYFDNSKKKLVRLTNKQRILTLVCILLFPYLRNKLDRRYKNLLEMTQFEREQMYINSSDNSADQIETQRRRDDLLIKYYKYFDALIESVSFVFKILFLLVTLNAQKQNKQGRWSISGYDNVLSWLLGQKTVRIDIKDLHMWKEEKNVFKSILFEKILGYNMDDMADMAGGAAAAAAASTGVSGSVQGSGPIGADANVSSGQKARFLMLRMAYFLGNFSKLMTLSFLFGFRWVEWFFMQEDKLIRKSTINVPDPPKILKHAKINYSKETKDLCLICNKERVNSACIPSGYVFCYHCIFPFVQENRCCPITRMPCTQIQIRKIYETS